MIPPWRRDPPLEYSGRNEADEGGQLPRVVKAREIAEFGDDGDRDEELDAAQGLQRLHDRIETPRGRALEEFRVEALEAIDLFIDGPHGFLKDDLLRRRRTHDLREVAAVRVVPGRAPDIVPAQSEEERFQPQLRVLARHARGIARATQIAEGFVLDRRHVDGGEIARAQEPRELDGVTPIRLHAVAWLLRDQRRRDHLTRQALRGEIPVEAVATRSRFIGERERACLALQASQQLIEVRLARANGADEHGRLGAPAGGVRDGDGIFVDVETDKQWSRLRHG